MVTKWLSSSRPQHEIRGKDSPVVVVERREREFWSCALEGLRSGAKLLSSTRRISRCNLLRRRRRHEELVPRNQKEWKMDLETETGRKRVHLMREVERSLRFCLCVYLANLLLNVMPQPLPVFLAACIPEPPYYLRPRLSHFTGIMSLCLLLPVYNDWMSRLYVNILFRTVIIHVALFCASGASCHSAMFWLLCPLPIFSFPSLRSSDLTPWTSDYMGGGLTCTLGGQEMISVCLPSHRCNHLPASPGKSSEMRSQRI
ncbi:hypothetical protein B0H34DRAFT_206705 [Crassisporium funariophilum]|nr:hypothetical protein B0H34DRAFT_283598 [Crassisporium funariophilum]KAF8148689.1 hypothetical protein B0H34DRAFT_206705 [Crassisporium funariophilum]